MIVGAGITRREDDRVLRGATRFIDDLEPPGCGHVAVVRSPHARAAITAVQTPGDADGLIAVITAADLEDAVQPFPVTCPAGAELADAPHPVLAGDEVRYAGQPVALVIAASRALAEDVAELVEVEYDPRDAVVEPRASDEELMRWHRRTGDVAAAFADAAHVVRGAYALPRLAAVPMEPRGCVADYDPAGDLLTVWGSFQDPHRPREQLTHILRRDPERTRVIVPDVGGAFGSKGVIAPEVAAVAAAAIRLGQPLKWTEDRLENLVASYQGRGTQGELELALDVDGRMLGLRARLWADLGAYLLTTTAIPAHTLATLITGVYDIAVADVLITGMRTDKVPTGPYRGAGRPDAAYMIEALVERAALELGTDAVAMRRRNLVRRFPYPTATGLEYDSGDFERCLDLALEMASAPLPDAEGGTLTGRGLGMYVERAGGAWESARITVAPDGRFELATSAHAHGQGHETTFAQIAADRLHAHPDAITVIHGDSDGPAGVGTFGSRSTAQAGSAVALAVEELVSLARGRAAQRLGAPPETVTLDGSGFRGSGTEPLGWDQLASPDEPLHAEARFASANVFSSGAYVADVAIDPATGATAVTRLIAVDDAGTLINPLLARGQVIGGAVQALGECLTEAVDFDDAGQNRSGSLLDYSLLTAAEIPPILTGEVETPSPLNPLGAKGAGEGGAVGTLPAVANAVADSLGRHLDPPYTADRVWRALQEGPERRPDEPAPPHTATPAPTSAAPPAAPAGPAARSPLALAAAIALAAVAVVVAARRIGRRR